MFSPPALSEQQVLTLYVIGTVLTLYPLLLVCLATYGYMRREAEEKAA